jgi:hypothetical protein
MDDPIRAFIGVWAERFCYVGIGITLMPGQKGSVNWFGVASVAALAIAASISNARDRIRWYKELQDNADRRIQVLQKKLKRLMEWVGEDVVQQMKRDMRDHVEYNEYKLWSD